jgi:hypothetical protein
MIKFIYIVVYNMPEWVYWLLVGLTILIFITAISISIYSMIKVTSLQTEINKLSKNNADFTNQINTHVSTQSQMINSGSRGQQGPRGLAGPQGPPGMSYSAAGPLLNMATKKVATPTAGKGQPSIVYLDDVNHSPVQYWFLSNNPDGSVSVQNKYSNNCLNTDDSNNIFSDVCNSSSNTQKFLWGPNMQLISKGQNGKCASIQDFNRTIGNSTNNIDPTTGQPVRNTNSGSVKRMALDTCSTSLNPRQTWYVGT